MAEKVIVDIEMSSEDVRKAEREIMAARKQVEELRKANKELDKSSEAFTKNALEIKRLNGEIRTNERVLIANTKAQKANEGSINQLRSQLSTVTVQWAKLSKEERENTDEGRKLVAQKKNLTNQLKALEKQTGDTRRNVGNYSEGMKEALVNQTALGQGANNLFNIMKANPLLLIVTLLAKFGGAVSQAQFIVDGFNKIMEPFNQMFQRAIGLVQELIDGGLSKLGEILRDPIGAIRNLGAEMSKAGQSGRRLADLTIEIEEAQNALILTEAKLRREIEQQRFAVEDLALSNEERQQAAKDAITAIQSLEQAQLEVLNKEIEAAEIRASQNDTDRKAQAKLNRLIAQRDQIQADSISRQKEVRNQLNTVNKQIADEERKAQEERVKIAEEVKKRKTEILQQEAERRAQIIADEIKRNNDAFLLGLKQQLLAEEITREEFEQKRLERELQILQAIKAARILSGQETLEVDNQITDLLIKNREKLAKTEKKEAETKKEIKDSELDVASDVSGALVDITKKTAGENTVLTKAAALTATGINIAQSVTKALAEGGPIAGPILAAISTAIGAVQQAKIKSAKTSFADGVIGLQGPGTETSDSISANLSKGESVITARATKVYAPLLAQMEESVGNRPNFQLGQRRFARGVINAGNLPAIGAGRSSVSEARNFERAIEKMKVFVSLTELNEKQREYSQARNFARISE